MLTFATEFPVHSSATIASFFASVKIWIAESPHFHFLAFDLDTVTSRAEWRQEVNGCILDTAIASFAGVQVARAHITVAQGAIFWHTDIIFSRDDVQSWVGVRVSNDSEIPTASLPDARKPVIVKTLLEVLKGGIDGTLVVSQVKHLLSEAQVKDAADLILGRAEQRMPIVYVSHPFSGKQRLDVNAFANDLAGMAHVVVEPSSEFARQLQRESGSTNVYDGAIGVYWPEGYGHIRFRPDRQIPNSVRAEVVREVRAALVNRRPLTRLTRAGMSEVASRQKREELDAAGSQQVADYATQFDAELEAKTSELQQAEQEIAKLRARLRAGKNIEAGGWLTEPENENDLLPGERREVIVDTVRQAMGNVPSGTRRASILIAFIEANPIEALRDDAKVRLREALRNYTGMDKKVRNELVDLGFSVTEDGKHYKLTYRDDPRYVFPLAKTPSDHRNGLNAASDIAGCIF